MSNLNIMVPYEDFMKMKADADVKASILQLLGTTFPDDTCMVIAIKSVIGYKDPVVDEPPTEDTPAADDTTNTEPAEGTEDTTEPTEPAEGTPEGGE